MGLSIHTIYQQVFKLWRKKRFELFVRLLRPSLEDTLLDVGGYPAFWTAHRQMVRRIDALNVHRAEWDASSAPAHNIHIVIGDGCALEIPSGSYDIGFSNSVIEHVGSYERQQQFASEIRRVSRALWVQTPAYECPIEPHYMTPLVHYLPRTFQRKILRWLTVWGWIERPSGVQIAEMVESTRLIRRGEMSRLFPDCEIITERMLWIIPKSYIAIRQKANSGI